MPGIVGIIGAGLHAAGRERLAAMTAPMRHGSFYRSGTQVDEVLGAGVGWIAHEDAFARDMPVWNDAGDIALIFSGEHFAARPVLARDLVQRYEAGGVRFIAELNGWFSGVILDRRAHQIVLFNDRYGVNRVFCHQTPDTFFFASEAKSLLHVLPATRAGDPRGLGELIGLGCVLQNRSLFRGIEALPPGAVWTFSHGQAAPTKATYFDPARWEAQPVLPAPDFRERLKEIWARTLPWYFRGEQSLALSLTGGVDSRLILAWVKDPAVRLATYTFGGRIRDCADVTLARELAGLCGRPHRVIPIADEFFKDFPTLAARTVFISDGGMDVTGAVDLHVQQVARQIAPVRLNGVYGGEILRRLVVFKPGLPHPGLFAPELEEAARTAADTYRQEIAGHALTFSAFKQAPWAMTAKFAVERSQVTLRSPYFDNELIALAYQSPATLVADNRVSLELIAAGNPRLAQVRTDRGLVTDSRLGLTRARHLFSEFLFKAEYAYDYGMPQWLARVDHAFAPLHLERLFLGRHKFHHFRSWYRDALAPHVRSILLDPRTLNRPIYQRRALEALVEAHTRGTANHTTALHKLLTVELMMRQLIDGPAAAGMTTP